MNLADKPCYPFEYYAILKGENRNHIGLTFRERLIIALASNQAVVVYATGTQIESSYELTAKNVIRVADAIIKELENK
jgi:hypothetical protein